MSTVAIASTVAQSIERWRVFLETGTVPEGLFAADVFADLTFPHWRLQTADVAGLVEVRRTGHPQPGAVRVEKVLGDESGYAMKIEERWHDGGQEWYCREALLCDLNERGEITDLSLYCTGDWDQARQDEHAETVVLLRA